MKRTIDFRGRNPRVECDGTSIWMNSEGVGGYVKSIELEYTEYEYGDYVLLWVKHDIPFWEIYTDDGFEEDISDILTNEIGFAVNVAFTEQGMQNHLIASMEPCNEDSAFILSEYIKAA